MERTELPAEKNPTGAGSPVQYVTFRVGTLFFGIDVAQAKEVIRYQTMAPVPLAPSYIRGLINLRGQIITAIDLRSLMQLQGNLEGMRPMNVVVQTCGEVISFLVDKVGDVIDVEQSWFEAPPETIASHIRCLLKGIFKLEKELLLVLDAAACIEKGMPEECKS